MTTTNGNKKILDLKRWEFCTPAPANTAAGVCMASSNLRKQLQLYLVNATTAYLYSPEEDGYVQLPSPALGGTFGAGAVARSVNWSVGTSVGSLALTATAGSTTTITTNQTLARDLRGFHVHFLAGTNAGKVKEIASNTIGSNGVITFTEAEGAAFDNTSQYRLLTPRWFVVNAGTAGAATWKFYDYATNTWTAAAQNPANGATDGRLVIPGTYYNGSSFEYFASGTATGGTGTTLQNSGKAWTTNQWTNYQVIITGGTGAGQVRTITANDATSITVATWGTNPSTDSTYVITGNDDHIYWLGNGAVTLYRYNLGANTWTTLSPGVARGGAPGAGMSASFANKVTDSTWTSENAIINGRRIYSFRGGGVATLDYYDIPSNAWTNAITYSPATETFTTGSKYIYTGNYIYIQKEATGRWFRYSIPESNMEGWTTMLYTQGAAVVGDTAFDVDYVDGATTIKYLYMIINTGAVVLRMMVI
jgi:hypothetical protein